MSFVPYCPLGKPACFASLVLCAVFGLGARGGAASVPANAPRSSQVSSRFAIADFDGDSRPDFATVEIGQIGLSHARYWIGLRMSTGTRQLIGVTAPVGGLEIASRDVNGDKSLDLIVTTTWLNRPVAILVNDGHGNFTVTDPAAFSPIVWSPEKIWNQPSTGVKDTAFAVLARAAGDCAVDNRASEASTPPELQTIGATDHPVFSLAVSVLGRAPPFFVQDV